jgi:hypothetical protein
MNETRMQKEKEKKKKISQNSDHVDQMKVPGARTDVEDAISGFQVVLEYLQAIRMHVL